MQFSLSLGTYAQDAVIPNDEGPFLDGVFSRQISPPLILPAKVPEFEPAPLFDADGNSNNVIVMLDFNDSAFDPVLSGKSEPGNEVAAEQAMLEAINAKESATAFLFAQPDQARYLIRPDDRLDPEARALLGAKDPDERLHRYLVLRYPTVKAALAAEAYLKERPGVVFAGVDKRFDFLWAPNDPYFPINSASAGRYQWGIHAMNFPSAWDRTKGHGYVSAVDGGLLNDQSPADLAANYRFQLSFIVVSYAVGSEFHGTHVLGIMGATANNGIGVAGACPTCSLAMARFNGTLSHATLGIRGLVERGMQVVNMSFGNATDNCASQAPLCDAITYADSKDVLLVAAAGNNASLTVPNFPASHASVLAVGGVQNTNPASPGQWARWYYGYDPTYGYVGSTYPGTGGVMGPARSIVSTVPTGLGYISNPAYLCGDNAGVDESGTPGDGYGSCTGTSMATPHIVALAGILRSINPRLSRNAIKDRIRASGSHYTAQTAQLGSGLPNARTAVDQTIAQTPNWLTPLFSMYSTGRLDYFYTTVPQMGSAASLGTLRPTNTTSLDSRYVSASGIGITGYPGFPGGYGSTVPAAEVWLFTTPENPKSASFPLVPLYRLSWKCGGGGRDLRPARSL